MALSSIYAEAKAGLALVRAGRFLAPPADARLRRVFYAPGVFVALARAVWNDKPTRERYLRALLPHAILTLVVGVALVVLGVGIGREDFNFHYDGKNLTRTVERSARSTAALVASLYGTLVVVEWFVIALTRQFHDALSFHVSTLVGVPPEEEIGDPRVRFDVDWLVNKMKRRVQGGVILLTTILPVLILYGVVVSPIVYALAKQLISGRLVEPLLNAVPNLLVPLIGAYWLGVFTLGKTAHAWRDEIVPDPLYLRGLDRAAARFPRALAPLHLYARILRRVLGLVRRPAYLVERAPWETIGFVMVRVVLSLPGVYILARPLIPVAATVIIAARSPETLSGLPVSLVFDERSQ
jgi:hypothetical protein